MLCAWVMRGDAYELRAEVYPWDIPLCREIGMICESYSAAPATQCKIIAWDRFADALLALKHHLTPLICGKAVLGIDGFGTLVMEVTPDGARAYRSEETASDMLSPLTAARLLFGMMPSALTAPLAEENRQLLSAWLPLPFSWNGQDRV
jgi:hypothetical protein